MMTGEKGDSGGPPDYPGHDGATGVEGGADAGFMYPAQGGQNGGPTGEY